MKKTISKEIQRMFPVFIATIALMYSVILLIDEIQPYKSIEWLMSGLGVFTASIIISFFVRLQKALKAPNVFISYSHEDYDMVAKMCKFLENYTVNILLDKNELHVGDNINQKLSDMVDSSDYFIYVNSKYSSKSDWAIKELEKAIDQRKKILPVQLDNSEMPEMISGLVYADFAQSFEIGVEQIGKALRHNKKMQSTKKVCG